MSSEIIKKNGRRESKMPKRRKTSSERNGKECVKRMRTLES
jgi:hypothetical protein